MPSTWIALAAMVIGAGVSAYGQYQSGKAQKAIANANAQEQDRQAKNALETMALQSRMQAIEAEQNFKFRKTESDARLANARNMENRALQQDAIQRANMRKRREDFAAMQAEQRNTIAASGLVEASGTPLDLLAETAAKIQQDRHEQGVQHEAQRRTLFAEADQERLGGELALQGATLDRHSGLTRAALTEAQGKAQYLAGVRQAEISRLSGRAAYEAGRYQAVGTIISGIGSAAGSFGGGGTTLVRGVDMPAGYRNTRGVSARPAGL